VAQPSEHDSSATWRDVRELKKALDVDVESGVQNLGRQHLRKDSLAALHSEFDYMSHALARLSNLGSHEEEEIFTKLNKVGRLHGVISALELPDESMEMVILKSCIPELRHRLGEIFPGCHFDPIYDPTEPSREDVELRYVAANNSTLPAVSGEMIEDVKRCYTAAKILRINASSSRATAMIKEESRPEAAAYYSRLLERNMTWLKENASYGRIEAEGCGKFESGVGGVSYLF
jgi:energy-converting hydrogenase A subunit M